MRAITLSQTGSALLVILLLMLMLAVIGFQMVTTSNDDIQMSGNSKNATKAFYAAESGQSIARTTLWTQYVGSASVDPPKKVGAVGSQNSYSSYLSKLGLNNGTTITLANNVDMGNGQVVERVDVARQDNGAGISFTVTSTGISDDGSKQVITSTYRVAGAGFRGFEFAVLAKNVNCILCHASLDNAARVFNNQANQKGTYDRVKMASLEALNLRTASAYSNVAGTLYTRGSVTDEFGNSITNLSPSGKGLGGYELDPTTGLIKEPLKTVDLVNTTGSPLPQYGNLYLNYPTSASGMTDGTLPDAFPPPFPDDNNNKMVDNSEFSAVASKAIGSVSGGVIYGVPAGGTYTATTLPGSGNQTDVNGTYSGNLILVGTDASPIVLNGDIAVDGDVVIQGKVLGTGQIYARGNVYVTGDVTYTDGTSNGSRTFGVGSDGTQNALSIAAGKNIMVGDYLTPAGGDIKSTASIDPGNLNNKSRLSFTMAEVALFNRSEWTKTQATLPDAKGNLVVNATYDPTYVPRYYTLNDGDPVYIYNKNTGNKGTYWNAATSTWAGKEYASTYDMGVLTKLDVGDPELAGSVQLAVSSTGNWISPTVLKSLWINDEAKRVSGQEFKIDGQLYTNNSIFALSRSTSNTGGKLTVNGALVASELGMLAENGLRLAYDARLKDFLKIKDNSQVAMDRLAWYAE